MEDLREIKDILEDVNNNIDLLIALASQRREELEQYLKELEGE